MYANILQRVSESILTGTLGRARPSVSMPMLILTWEVASHPENHALSPPSQDSDSWGQSSTAPFQFFQQFSWGQWKDPLASATLPGTPKISRMAPYPSSYKSLRFGIFFFNLSKRFTKLRATGGAFSFPSSIGVISKKIQNGFTPIPPILFFFF